MRKSFTLVELLVTVVVVIIITTIGLTGYQAAIEQARARVCATNLRALQSAVKMWALENDVIPATLGQLEKRHLERAYAEVIAPGDWLTRAAYWLGEQDSRFSAHAQFLTPANLRRFGANAQIFTCPSDRNGGISYGITLHLPASPGRP